MNVSKKTARIAGLLYLAVIIFGVFAEMIVRGKMIVPGNAVETVRNIMASPGLFRLGFVSDLMMITAFFFLPLVLYSLLKSVNQNHASLMVLSALMSVPIMSVNMLNHFAVMVMIDGGGYLSAFDQEQINGLISLFLDLHKNGYRIAQIFFGLWLFPLGYLVYKSGFIPKIIGIFLIIACFSFLIDFFLFFLLPAYSSSLSSLVTLPTVIGEFSLCFWLLINPGNS